MARRIFLAALLSVVASAALAMGFMSNTGSMMTHNPDLTGGPVPSIAQRAPTAADNSVLGFTANQYWLDVSTGTMYQATSVTGSAVWTTVPLASLPLDVAPVGAGGVAYGTMKLRAAYAGPAFSVTRASDSTTHDVGFIGNLLDTATEDAFCAATSCTVNTWYDQSGNGLDATQATVSSQPQAYKNTLGSSGVTGQRAISLGSATYSGGSQRELVVPQTLAFTGNNLAIGIVYRNFATGGSFPIFTALPNGGITLTQNWATTGGFSSSTAAYNNFVSLKPQSFLFNRGNGAGAAGNVGGRWVNGYFTSTGFAVNTNTFSGANLGNLVTPISGDYGAVIVWPANLTTATASAAHLSLTKEFQIAPQVHGQLHADGDSLTYGFNSDTTLVYPYQLQKGLKYPLEVRQTGVPGDTCAQLNTRYPGTIASYFNGAVINNVLVIWCGTNDIHAGASPATAYGSLTSYIAAAHATGWKVVVATMLPRGAGDEVNRLAFNLLVLANAGGADGVADPASSTVIGCPTCNANPTYYAADDVHLLGPGIDILAPYMVQAVNPLLN